MTRVAPGALRPSPLVAPGEVGLLADENAQRLCTIFSESAWGCLMTLRDMSAGHGPSRFQGLYRAGLACVQNWNADVVREEVSRLQAQYPEANTIFQYVYVLLIKEVGDDASIATGPSFPALEEVYHVFLCRLCACPDVAIGERFFSMPLLERRVVYIDCFRNAFHDVLRRRTGGKPAMTGPVVPQVAPPLLSSDPGQEADEVSIAPLPSKCGSSSSFRQAVTSAAKEKKGSSEAPLQNNSQCDGAGKEEEVGDEEKCVEVSRSPCFFDDDDGNASAWRSNA